MWPSLGDNRHHKFSFRPYLFKVGICQHVLFMAGFWSVKNFGGSFYMASDGLHGHQWVKDPSVKLGIKCVWVLNFLYPLV